MLYILGSLGYIWGILKKLFVIQLGRDIYINMCELQVNFVINRHQDRLCTIVRRWRSYVASTNLTSGQ